MKKLLTFTLLSLSVSGFADNKSQEYYNFLNDSGEACGEVLSQSMSSTSGLRVYAFGDKKLKSEEERKEVLEKIEKMRILTGIIRSYCENEVEPK